MLFRLQLPSAIFSHAFVATAIRCGADPERWLPWSVQEVHALAGGTDRRRDHQERQWTPAQVSYPHFHMHNLINTAVVTAALILSVILFVLTCSRKHHMHACAPCAVNLSVISRFQ